MSGACNSLKRSLLVVLLSFSGSCTSKEPPPAKAEYLPEGKTVTTPAAASGTIAPEKLLPKNDFALETVGAEPLSFSTAVGYWLIGLEGTKKVLVVDGRKWEEGQASAGLAEKAKTIYGERYAEFLDGVKAYAYFPFAVAKYVDNFTDGEISVRFKPIAGRIDQAAGIIFNVKPNGDYLILRANALEQNLVLFNYLKGKRSRVKWISDVPIPTGKWQELKLVVKGTEVLGYLDGIERLKHTLAETVSGKIGLWSKADSVTYFDEYKVKPAASKPAGKPKT